MQGVAHRVVPEGASPGVTLRWPVHTTATGRLPYAPLDFHGDGLTRHDRRRPEATADGFLLDSGSVTGRDSRSRQNRARRRSALLDPFQDERTEVAVQVTDAVQAMDEDGRGRQDEGERRRGRQRSWHASAGERPIPAAQPLPSEWPSPCRLKNANCQPIRSGATGTMTYSCSTPLTAKTARIPRAGLRLCLPIGSKMCFFSHRSDPDVVTAPEVEDRVGQDRIAERVGSTESSEVECRDE